jgi:ribonuclease P protein component
MPHRFPLASRLRRQSEFSGVFDGGVKRHGRLMSVFVRSGRTGQARLGIAASKKLGNAVERNKAKRRVRELFRHANQPPGVDIVVIPRRPLLDAPFASVQREFESLVDWAVRHGRRASSPLPSGPVADRGL